jgi:DNA-binding transcriptional LysR family regulator
VARAKKLRLRDLADLPLIVVPRDKSPNTYHGTISACRAAGFMPKIVPGDNTELLSRLGMVASNVGVMLASEYTRRLQVKGVAYVPVMDLPDYLQWELVLAWDGRAMTPALRELVNISREISKSMGNAGGRAPRAYREASDATLRRRRKSGKRGS